MANNYDKNSIISLDPIEHVRKRPGVYIGSIDEDGLHHLINEVIDNVVDEHLSSNCDHISIDIQHGKTSDGVEIKDNGRGIPVGYRDDIGMDVLTATVTQMLTGGKYEQGAYFTSSGQNGQGIKAVNALSRMMIVTVVRDKIRYQQPFQKGVPVTDGVSEEGTKDSNGTTIYFEPDDEILRCCHVNMDRLKEKLIYLSSILPGFTIDLYEDNKFTEQYKEDKSLEKIHNQFPLSLSDQCDKLYDQKFNPIQEVDIRVSYYKTHDSSIQSFVNTINTIDGGSHEKAVLDSIRSSLFRITGRNFSLSQIKTGLNLTISVFHTEPVYRGQAKTREMSWRRENSPGK